jgi:TM2 domain-containing membrane protein YozV
MQMEYDARKKSTVLAYLAWFFLGGLGVHRGRSGSGAALLVLTILGFVLTVIAIGPLLWIVVGIWLLVDLFLIPGMVQDYNVSLAHSLQASAAPRPPAAAQLVHPTQTDLSNRPLDKWAD